MSDPILTRDFAVRFCKKIGIDPNKVSYIRINPLEANDDILKFNIEFMPSWEDFRDLEKE